MSAKQLLRVAAVLAAVLVLWGVVALASRSEGSSERGDILPRIDTAAIDTIALTGPADSALLTRAGETGWRVNGHTADPQIISELLKALVDTGRSHELVASNPASHSRLRVTEDSGRRVRIVSDGRVVAELIAGKQAVNWGGAYIRRRDDPKVYAVRGDLPNALTRSGDEWRDRTITTVVPESVATIEIRRGRKSYELQRKGSTWRFASGAATDSAAVSNLLSSYKKIEAQGFATRAQRDSLHSARPRRAVRLLDQSGQPLVSLEFDSIASGIWVRRTDGGVAGPKAEQSNTEAYRLDTWTADKLAPADTTLRKR